MSIPTLFDGLTVVEADKEEMGTRGLSLGILFAENKRCFKIEGRNWQGAITAGHIEWSEDDSENYTESKLLIA